MRLAAALLLALPAAALAQTAPTAAPPKSTAPAASTKGPEHPAAPVKPAAPKPATAVLAKPSTAVPAKPDGKADGKTDGKSGSKPAAKPAGKPGTKPAPHRPATAAKPAPAAPATEPAPAATPTEPNKGSNTGLPLPRFAALRSDDVNFRTGPGTRYPIEWVYKRRDLPVEIEREFEIWRLVKDPTGNKGWVHQATLTGRRTAVVAAGSERALRASANDTAAPVAKLKPGVIIRLRACEAKSEWCQAQVGDYRGFIRRTEIWGVLPDEVIQ